MACLVSHGLHTWALEICPCLLSLNGWMVPESGHLLIFCWSTFVPVAYPLMWQIPLRPVTTSTLALVTGKLLFYTLRARKEGFFPRCELLFWQSAAPGHTCAVSTSPHHWFPSPPHPLRAWSCSEGILHIWQPSPCQHRFSEKGFLVGKMVMLTLTVTRDNEGCFFLIFICCAGF